MFISEVDLAIHRGSLEFGIAAWSQSFGRRLLCGELAWFFVVIDRRAVMGRCAFLQVVLLDWGWLAWRGERQTTRCTLRGADIRGM